MIRGYVFVRENNYYSQKAKQKTNNTAMPPAEISTAYM